VSRSLPLSHEIVGTAFSLLIMWVLQVASGVVGGERRTGTVEWYEDLVSGENSCLVDLGAATCPGWLTGPQWWSYRLELNA